MGWKVGGEGAAPVAGGGSSPPPCPPAQPQAKISGNTTAYDIIKIMIDATRGASEAETAAYADAAHRDQDGDSSDASSSTSPSPPTLPSRSSSSTLSSRPNSPLGVDRFPRTTPLAQSKTPYFAAPVEAAGPAAEAEVELGAATEAGSERTVMGDCAAAPEAETKADALEAEAEPNFVTPTRTATAADEPPALLPVSSPVYPIGSCSSCPILVEHDLESEATAKLAVNRYVRTSDWEEGRGGVSQVITPPLPPLPDWCEGRRSCGGSPPPPETCPLDWIRHTPCSAPVSWRQWRERAQPATRRPRPWCQWLGS